VTDEGTLSVDSRLRLLSGGSPVEGVYALGDIANRYQLKHVANREARVVAHNLEHPTGLRSIDYTGVPFAVFSNPQVASLGPPSSSSRSSRPSLCQPLFPRSRGGPTGFTRP
jgi:mycothione reductase